MAGRKVAQMAGSGYMIVDCDMGRVSVYIHAVFPTRKEAERERADLLRYFSASSPWRKQLCIKTPEGRVYNPESASENPHDD